LITLQVNNVITLDPEAVPGFLIQKIKSDLTLPNPDYQQAVKYGFSTYGKNPEIKLFQVKDSGIALPRGYGPDLVKLLRKHGIKYRMYDQRLTLHPVNFNSRIKLRKYQEPAVEKLIKQRQGGVSAPCGSGKTMILLEAMARIRQPSLWVCHTYELLNQTRDRAVEAFDMDLDEIGVIANGKVTLGSRLTLALVQTLRDADLSDLSGRFGAIFIDEAHHLGASSFFETVNAFPALYRLWASATPERGDGLTRMVHTAGGPVVCEIGLEDLPVIIPELAVIETEYNGHSENYTELITDLIQNERRNRLIVDTVIKEAPGNYSLVLSDRIDHLHILADMIREAAPTLRVEILTGQMPKKQRVAIMERARNREIDVLLATQLAREGLDLPHLNRLFLVTPKRAAGATQQEVGRVMRPCEGKHDAVVFDFVDFNSPILRSQYWRRQDVYRQLGMDIKRKACRRQALAGVS